ncbi:MAG: hypothetical protein H6638_09230 [Ardenticatenales bacterium]|nr:hypothetical protein [Ardenticatenales bacterium]
MHSLRGVLFELAAGARIAIERCVNVGSGRRARPRGPPCPTAWAAVHAQPDDHGGSSLHGGYCLWVAAVPDRVGRRARHRVTIAVHARQRTTTAGRPYMAAMVCGCP